jgi:membrane-bound lytic murein transglycosylase B
MELKKLFKAAFFSAAALTASETTAQQSSPRVTVVHEKDKKYPTVAFNMVAWRSWMTDMRQQAAARGYSRKIIDDVLPDTLTPINRVIQLDRYQPDKKKDITDYLSRIVTDVRVNNGLQKANEEDSLLQQVAAVYPKIDPDLIVALWGVETSYGANTGNYRLTSALATLAFDPRRSTSFTKHFFSAVEILKQEDMPADSLRGSWAGAFGQVQFMPDTYRARAVDFDGDGRRDLWRNYADIFASAANLMTVNGWKKGEPWGREVVLPEGFNPAHFTRKLIGKEKDVGKKHSLTFWRDLGILTAEGQPLPLGEYAGTASLIRPDGPDSKKFYLAYDNYTALYKWNSSHYFVVSVGMMMDRLKAAQPGDVNQYALPPPSPSP